MRKFSLILSFLACWLFSNAQGYYYELLRGRVMNQDSVPIAGAVVEIEGGYMTAVTDESGCYSFSATTDQPLDEDFLDNNTDARVSADGCATLIIDGSQFTDRVPLRGEKDFILFDTIRYKAGQWATVILPVAPDPDTGAYYRLSHYKNKAEIHNGRSYITESWLVFSREKSPEANVPYIFVPERDYSLSLHGMDLSIEPGETRLEEGISFIGTYDNIVVDVSMNSSLKILDKSDDCFPGSEVMMPRVGGTHAFIGISDYRLASGLKIVLEDLPSTQDCDINKDGKVDITDVVGVINTIAGDTRYKDSADVNSDGRTDITDVVDIINVIAGQ